MKIMWKIESQDMVKLVVPVVLLPNGFGLCEAAIRSPILVRRSLYGII